MIRAGRDMYAVAEFGSIVTVEEEFYMICKVLQRTSLWFVIKGTSVKEVSSRGLKN